MKLLLIKAKLDGGIVVGEAERSLVGYTTFAHCLSFAGQIL